MAQARLILRRSLPGGGEKLHEFKTSLTGPPKAFGISTSGSVIGLDSNITNLAHNDQRYAAILHSRGDVVQIESRNSFIDIQVPRKDIEFVSEEMITIEPSSMRKRVLGRILGGEVAEIRQTNLSIINNDARSSTPEVANVNPEPVDIASLSTSVSKKRIDTPGDVPQQLRNVPQATAKSEDITGLTNGSSQKRNHLLHEVAPESSQLFVIQDTQRSTSLDRSDLPMREPSQTNAGAVAKIEIPANPQLTHVGQDTPSLQAAIIQDELKQVSALQQPQAPRDFSGPSLDTSEHARTIIPESPKLDTTTGNTLSPAFQPTNEGVALLSADQPGHRVGQAHIFAKTPQSSKRKINDLDILEDTYVQVPSDDLNTDEFIPSNVPSPSNGRFEKRLKTEGSFMVQNDKLQARQSANALLNVTASEKVLQTLAIAGSRDESHNSLLETAVVRSDSQSNQLQGLSWTNLTPSLSSKENAGPAPAPLRESDDAKIVAGTPTDMSDGADKSRKVNHTGTTSPDRSDETVGSVPSPSKVESRAKIEVVVPFLRKAAEQDPGDAGSPQFQTRISSVAYAGTSVIGTSTKHLKFLKRKGISKLDAVKDADVLCIGGDQDLKRTVKILTAILQGKPIVTDAWVTASFNNVYIKSTEPYLAHNAQTENEWGTTLKDALARGKQGQGSQLLLGWTIVATPGLKTAVRKVTLEETKELCLLSGAQAFVVGMTKKAMRGSPSAMTMILGVKDDGSLSQFHEDWRLYTPEVISYSILRGVFKPDEDEFLIGASTPKQA